MSTDSDHAHVDEALADVAVHARAQEVGIVDAVSDVTDGPRYWGDEQRVRQILVNLLTNAIKFTAPSGRVTITAGTSGPHASVVGGGPWTFLRVEDTGRGFPPELLGTIFEPFNQTVLADQDRGTGLGLSISRQLARAMGGDITVSSRLGVGSTFTLWLVAEPECQTAPRSSR